LNKLLSLQINAATLYGNFAPRQYQKAQIAAKSEHFRGPFGRLPPVSIAPILRHGSIFSAMHFIDCIPAKAVL
jgi:hypothetical protein